VGAVGIIYGFDLFFSPPVLNKLRIVLIGFQTHDKINVILGRRSETDFTMFDYGIHGSLCPVYFDIAEGCAG
jgi:hypothetical protein